MTAPWMETTLPTILSHYDSRDVYNADEFGLFYRAFPTKSLHLKGEKCSGGKNSKIRLTGLAAANMCGEKIPMFVIGKSQKPRCFKGIRSTPCRYRGQKKSWMNSELFEEWVREQDRKFMLEGRNIALVIDNCPAHPHIENLQSTTLYFLPPNTTSSLQPMDQGVIRSLKCKYRTRIIQKYITAIDNEKQIPNISMLEAMKMLVHSWSEISETTIVNCFAKAGFKEGMTDEEDDPFSTLKRSIDQLRQREENLIPNYLTYEDVLTIDDNIAVMGGVMTDKEIVQDIRDVVEEEVQEVDEVVDEEDSDESLTKPTTKEMRQAIDTLLNFSMFTESGEIGTMAMKASNLFEKELCKSMRQTSISDFFRKN